MHKKVSGSLYIPFFLVFICEDKITFLKAKVKKGNKIRLFWGVGGFYILIDLVPGMDQDFLRCKKNLLSLFFVIGRF